MQPLQDQVNEIEESQKQDRNEIKTQMDQLASNISSQFHEFKSKHKLIFEKILQDIGTNETSIDDLNSTLNRKISQTQIEIETLSKEVSKSLNEVIKTAMKHINEWHNQHSNSLDTIAKVNNDKIVNLNNLLMEQHKQIQNDRQKMIDIINQTNKYQTQMQSSLKQFASKIRENMNKNLNSLQNLLSKETGYLDRVLRAEIKTRIKDINQLRDESNEKLNLFEETLSNSINERKRSYEIVSNKVESITRNSDNNDETNKYIDHSLKTLNKRVDRMSESYLNDIKSLTNMIHDMFDKQTNNIKQIQNQMQNLWHANLHHQNQNQHQQQQPPQQQHQSAPGMGLITPLPSHKNNNNSDGKNGVNRRNGIKGINGMNGMTGPTFKMFRDSLPSTNQSQSQSQFGLNVSNFRNSNNDVSINNMNNSIERPHSSSSSISSSMQAIEEIRKLLKSDNRLDSRLANQLMKQSYHDGGRDQIFSNSVERNQNNNNKHDNNNENAENKENKENKEKGKVAPIGLSENQVNGLDDSSHGTYRMDKMNEMNKLIETNGGNEILVGARSNRSHGKEMDGNSEFRTVMTPVSHRVLEQQTQAQQVQQQEAVKVKDGDGDGDGDHDDGVVNEHAVMETIQSDCEEKWQDDKILDKHDMEQDEDDNIDIDDMLSPAESQGNGNDISDSNQSKKSNISSQSKISKSANAKENSNENMNRTENEIMNRTENEIESDRKQEINSNQLVKDENERKMDEISQVGQIKIVESIDVAKPSSDDESFKVHSLESTQKHNETNQRDEMNDTSNGADADENHVQDDDDNDDNDDDEEDSYSTEAEQETQDDDDIQADENKKLTEQNNDNDEDSYDDDDNFESQSQHENEDDKYINQDTNDTAIPNETEQQEQQEQQDDPHADVDVDDLLG